MQNVSYPVKRKKLNRRALRPADAAALPEKLETFKAKLRTQGERFAAMVLVQRDTGMRPGELCALQRSQLLKTLRGYALVIDAGLVRKNEKMVRTSTKTGNSRMVPIMEDTAQLLLAMPDRGPYFFTAANGKPVRMDNYRRQFRSFAKSIDMPELTPHKLRHTYISLLLQAGKDLKAVQKLVGHATPQMVMEIYAETSDESMADAPMRLKELLESARQPDEKEKAG
jgi:integrase